MTVAEFSLTSADVMVLLNVDVQWYIDGLPAMDNAEFHRPGQLAEYRYIDRDGARQFLHVACYGIGVVDYSGQTVTGHEGFRRAFPDGTIPNKVSWRAPSWIEVIKPTGGRNVHRLVSTAQSECLSYLRAHVAG